MARVPALILLALLALLFVPPPPLYAQQAEVEDTEPQEYGEEEFSPFLRDLRRAEIVMLGSFPITLFATLEVFDLYRYLATIEIVDGQVFADSSYTPWPFRPPDAAPYKPEQIAGILVTALSASLLIAVADYIIGREKEKRSER